jgi:hypothetical protein
MAVHNSHFIAVKNPELQASSNLLHMNQRNRQNN